MIPLVDIEVSFRSNIFLGFDLLTPYLFNNAGEHFGIGLYCGEV